MNFAGKNVLITGASRGIGKATAIAFANQGAHVALNYRANDAAAEETLGMLAGSGHHLLKADVSTSEGCQELMAQFARTFSRLDVLVNNAAIAVQHPLDETDFDTWVGVWDATLDTNVRSVANMCFLGAKLMKATGGGSIVNVSSRGAFRGEPDMPAYGASKAAVNALSQSLARKLAQDSISVMVVAPGFTVTEMGVAGLTDERKKELTDQSPFKRMAEPEEVAHSILFLASPGAAYNSGAILDINGASHLR